MTGTAVATLPSGSDPAQWSPEEKALVEAAGLVAVDARSGEKTPAPRPVVAAFLQHCQRTGLDPFARQIYCLARKSKGDYKWTTQISIDGARLVAERTGQYEGQTTPEFTSDGVTWTQVWLSSEPPRAARVGVFRRGFREQLYAIALWEAYAVYQDEWANGSRTGKQTLSAMWSKMGPLMLAKCAEMLALRKAFPQDLSGLYSTEEMDQAGAPRAVVADAEQQAPVATTVTQIPDSTSPGIATPKLTKDWAALAAAASTVAELTALANEADGLGEIGVTVSQEQGAVIDVLKRRRGEIEAAAAVTLPLVDDVEKPKGKRQWVREARLLTTRRDVHHLYQEALAAGALAQVLEELGAIENTLPDPDAEKPAGEGAWAEADEVPVTEWASARIPDDDEDPAAVFDATIEPDEEPF